MTWKEGINLYNTWNFEPPELVQNSSELFRKYVSRQSTWVMGWYTRDVTYPPATKWMKESLELTEAMLKIYIKTSLSGKISQLGKKHK